MDSALLPFLAWSGALAPLALAAACAAAALARTPAGSWRAARAGTGALLLVAAAALLVVLTHGPARSALVRIDLPGALVLLLVALLGWVLARYSATYLAGEPGERRYARWLLATLAGATGVVVSNDLLLLTLAWWGTSLSLHRLLLFYPQRAPAQAAAHKKWLLARAADLCMAGACALLLAAAGGLRLDALAADAALGPSPLVQAAMVLVAIAAILKCAQLPFHGWLMQVMEAPTPVSALLHAGVVNLGGFVLLRLAPLVDQSPAAQALLVMVGTTTAVLAALVMATRISVKVALAWSTCAQMGFMLMQCGLGLWEMALLHLLAHSLYKAHAFLGAGTAVRETMVGKLVAGTPQPSWGGSLLALAGGLLLVAAAGLLWGVQRQAQPGLWVMGAVVALAVHPLLAGGTPALLRGWLVAFALAWLYFGLHTAMARWVVPTGTPGALWWLPACGFALLWVLQAAVRSGGPLAARLHPWFYGGLFLDERVSRLLFRLSAPPVASLARTADGRS